MSRLTELFNVNHFIVSQVNVHVFPFLQKSLKLGFSDRIFRVLSFFLHSELKHRLPQLIELGIFPKLSHFFLSILSQKYSGHITVVPMSFANVLQLFTSPTPTIMQQATLQGERATWPSKKSS